jgi:hypothetical protein
MIRQKLSTFLQACSEFWFFPVSSTGVSLFRICTALVLFVFYSIRAFDFEFIYSTKGIIPFELFAQVFAGFYSPWIGRFFTTDLELKILLGVHLVSLFALACGFWPRVFAFVSFFSHTVFLQRSFSTIYGADYVASVLLFSLMFIKSGSNFHLRFWEKDFKGSWSWSVASREKINEDFTSAAVRALQVQICIIYFVGGIEKLRGTSWWDGSALWKALSHNQLAAFDLSWLAPLYFVTTLMTLITLMWEIFFPALVASRQWRKFSLGFGVMLHLGIGVLMSLPFFSLLMVSSYFVFIDFSKNIEKPKLRHNDLVGDSDLVS